MIRYWLCKSEPETYSIDDLKRDKKTAWDCIRNYQARNFLREMKVGDQILFYHSNAEPPAVVGIASVTKTAFADITQFDKKGDCYDAKATPDKPRWYSPEIKFVEKFRSAVPIDALRQRKDLQKLLLLQRGSRLSVTPVTKDEFNVIATMGRQSEL